MKAIIKSDGQVVEIIRFGCDGKWTEYSDSEGQVVMSQLNYYKDFDFDIDWEQRRYELTKSFEAASLANPEYLQYATTGRRIDTPEERLADVSIRYADALIKKLQER